MITGKSMSKNLSIFFRRSCPFFLFFFSVGNNPLFMCIFYYDNTSEQNIYETYEPNYRNNNYVPLKTALLTNHNFRDSRTNFNFSKLFWDFLFWTRNLCPFFKFTFENPEIFG